MKTNNMAMGHEKNQIIIGISSVWSEPLLSAEESLGP